MGSIQEIIIGKGPSKTLRGKDDRRWSRNYTASRRGQNLANRRSRKEKKKKGQVYGRWLIHPRSCCKVINIRYLY